MTRSEVESLYGPLLRILNGDDQQNHMEISIMDMIHIQGTMWGNTYGYHNEGLSFVFNKYTNQVVLIRYQRNRHGNSNVLMDVKKI